MGKYIHTEKEIGIKLKHDEVRDFLEYMENSVTTRFCCPPPFPPPMTSVSSFSLFSSPSAASPFPALQNTGSAPRSLEWQGWQQGAEDQEYLRDRLRLLPFITLLSLPTSTLPPPPERQSKIK